MCHFAAYKRRKEKATKTKGDGGGHGAGVVAVAYKECIKKYHWSHLMGGGMLEWGKKLTIKDVTESKSKRRKKKN